MSHPFGVFNSNLNLGLFKAQFFHWILFIHIFSYVLITLKLMCLPFIKFYLKCHFIGSISHQDPTHKHTLNLPVNVGLKVLSSLQTFLYEDHVPLVQEIKITKSKIPYTFVMTSQHKLHACMVTNHTWQANKLINNLG